MKALACLFALLLTACSMEHTIGEHAIGYNRSVEQSADSLMILNILRARSGAAAFYHDWQYPRRFQPGRLARL